MGTGGGAGLGGGVGGLVLLFRKSSIEPPVMLILNEKFEYYSNISITLTVIFEVGGRVLSIKFYVDMKPIMFSFPSGDVR